MHFREQIRRDVYLIRGGDENSPARVAIAGISCDLRRERTSRGWIDWGRNLPAGVKYPSLRTWKGIIQPRLSIDDSPHSVTQRSKFAMRRTDLYIQGSPSWNHDIHGGHIGVCVRRTKLTSQGWILLLLVITLISGDDDDPRSAVYTRTSCIVAVIGLYYIHWIRYARYRIFVIFYLDRISKEYSDIDNCPEYRFEFSRENYPIKFSHFTREVIIILGSVFPWKFSAKNPLFH